MFAGTWDMIRGKIEAVTGRSKSKDKQNKVRIVFISIINIFVREFHVDDFLFSKIVFCGYKVFLSYHKCVYKHSNIHK